MKIILCTGDSHTWGQGADGVDTSFPTPLVCGDLRPVGFSYRCYVNLLRSRIRDIYGGEFAEYTPQSFSDVKFPIEHHCLTLRCGDTLHLPSQEAYRFVFRQLDKTGTVSIFDGNTGLFEHTVSASQQENAYDLWFVETNRADSIRLTVTSGIVWLYRLETYSGPFAVINGGIGSCPSGAYAKQWFDRYVEPYHPWLTIAEAHSINDWLQYSPNDSRAGLSDLMVKLLSIGSRIMMLSVSPVDQNQYNDKGYPYSDYVAISRAVAENYHIPYADAHTVMQKYLDNGHPLFADKWHVNNEGHALYTKTILETLWEMGLFPEACKFKE